VTTRHNLNINPAAKSNITNWQQSGAVAPAQATGLSGTVRTTGAKWTTGTYQTTAFGAASAGVSYTVSAYFLTASFPQSGKTLYLNWNGAGTQTNAKTVALTDGVWTRLEVTGTAPAGTTGVGLLLDGINASVSAMTITGVLAEASSAAADTYFDGDSTNATWDGTSGNSASTLTDTPAGLTVSVYDGTVEKTATVTVWNGTSELTATADSIAP
jgi:hypothetical protein